MINTRQRWSSFKLTHPLKPLSSCTTELTPRSISSKPILIHCLDLSFGTKSSTVLPTVVQGRPLSQRQYGGARMSRKKFCCTPLRPSRLRLKLHHNGKTEMVVEMMMYGCLA